MKEPEGRGPLVMTLRRGVVRVLDALMRGLTWLPVSWQLAICQAGGAAAYRIARRRRHVVETNLRLCLPELSAARRRELSRQHFRALGASLAEMAMGWYGPIDKIRSLVSIEGTEHLEAALNRGRGVILFSGHFTSFEIFFPVLAPLCPRLCGMYKAQSNELMNNIMTAGRLRNFDRLFSKNSVREMIRELAGNAVVWYAADQSYAEKNSALIPFFGEPAMTNTSISRIARITGATILPYFPRRMTDGSGYRLTIAAPLDGFPSDDPVADTHRLVAGLEAFVRLAPEQYWWVHQRFKWRPAPYPDVYLDPRDGPAEAVDNR